ncbi:hypothetical protein J25TS5_34440 [Paenibacillus faecis]|nr:hypothetical protein J25TS5_34440 [Paenibacillus faecis]
MHSYKTRNRAIVCIFDNKKRVIMKTLSMSFNGEVQKSRKKHSCQIKALMQAFAQLAEVDPLEKNIKWSITGMLFVTI